MVKPAPDNVFSCHKCQSNIQELLCSPVSRFCSSMLCLNVNKFTFSNAKLKKPSSPQVGGCDNLTSNTGSLLPSIDFLPMLATFWERNQNSILVGQKLPTITNNNGRITSYIRGHGAFTLLFILLMLEGLDPNT